MRIRLTTPLLCGLALVACTSFSTASDVKDLAGQWKGWADTGFGGYRSFTVRVNDQGVYEAMAADGGRMTGTITSTGGHLRWSDGSGASGPLRMDERDGKRRLRGRRADGTGLFEWRLEGPTDRTQ